MKATVEFLPGRAYGTAGGNTPSRHLPECLGIPSGPWVSQALPLPRLSEAVLRIRDSGVGYLRQRQLQGGGGVGHCMALQIRYQRGLGGRVL